MDNKIYLITLPLGESDYPIEIFKNRSDALEFMRRYNAKYDDEYDKCDIIEEHFSVLDECIKEGKL